MLANGLNFVKVNLAFGLVEAAARLTDTIASPNWAKLPQRRNVRPIFGSDVAALRMFRPNGGRVRVCRRQFGAPARPPPTRPASAATHRLGDGLGQRDTARATTWPTPWQPQTWQAALQNSIDGPKDRLCLRVLKRKVPQQVVLLGTKVSKRVATKRQMRISV